MHVDKKQLKKEWPNENAQGFSFLAGTKSLRMEAFREENYF